MASRRGWPSPAYTEKQQHIKLRNRTPERWNFTLPLSELAREHPYLKQKISRVSSTGRGGPELRPFNYWRPKPLAKLTLWRTWMILGTTLVDLPRLFRCASIKPDWSNFLVWNNWTLPRKMPLSSVSYRQTRLEARTQTFLSFQATIDQAQQLLRPISML